METGVSKATGRGAVRCDYCGGPMPFQGSSETARGSRFCCYGCRILGESRPPSSGAPKDTPHSPSPWFRIGIGVALASQAMLLGFAVNLTPPEGSIRPFLHLTLAGSALLVMGVLGWPLLRASWDCVCRRRITVELMFLAGIVGAFGASVYSSFTGIGAVYYEIVSVLLVVYSTGKALTAKARERALAETARLRDTFDVVRRLRMDGSQERCSAASVKSGDRIRVLAGEPVPVDGRILSGTAFVRETPLTGEPFPVVRRPGDRVLAGSWSEDGDLDIEATANGSARQLDDLIRWVEQARSDADTPAGNDSALRPLVDRLTAWFLPLVLGVATLTLLAWSVQGRWSDGLFNALSVLLVACPCALGLAAPLALWNALAQLAARGMVFRSASALERLASARHVVFDKTGTLSEEEQSLIDFAVVPGTLNRKSLLDLIQSVQARSSHPVARAFCRQGVASVAGIRVVSAKSVPACGVEAWVESGRTEHHVQIGQRGWVMAAGRPTERESQILAELRTRASDQRVYVAVDGQLAGIGIVRERLRDSVVDAWRQLEGLGCDLSVFTGDHSDRALQLLNQSGSAVGEVAGGLKPIDKADRVRKLEATGQRVAFVGDGVNDAPALRAASVGIALNSGASLATATADVVLCGSDLREVPRAIQLARDVRQGIRSNLMFAAAYNLIGIALAATGRLGPISAALLMVGSSTIVSWRALRRGGDDCGFSGSTIPSPTPRRNSLIPGPQWTSWFWAGTVLVQVPLLAWLGQLGAVSLAWVSAVALVLAWTSHWRPQRSTAWQGWLPAGSMAASMLGPGNLGMLIGWWVEAGFGPVMKGGVCLCCQSHHYFALTGKIPWMYVGMLVGGLPSMWAGLPQLKGRLGRVPLLLLAAVGMTVGMAFGVDLVLAWLGPRHPFQFLGAFLGMTAGMLAGMFFMCGAGEALVAAWRRR